MKTTSRAWLVKVGGGGEEQNNRTFVSRPASDYKVRGGSMDGQSATGGYLVRSFAGMFVVHENRHTAPVEAWEPVPISWEQALPIFRAVAKHVIARKKEATARHEALMRAQASAMYRMDFPYVVIPGRYDIPRVWGRREDGKWWLYDRKNNKWGKRGVSRVPLNRIVGCMDEAAFQCWRETKCRWQDVDCTPSRIPLGVAET